MRGEFLKVLAGILLASLAAVTIIFSRQRLDFSKEIPSENLGYSEKICDQNKFYLRESVPYNFEKKQSTDNLRVYDLVIGSNIKMRLSYDFWKDNQSIVSKIILMNQQNKASINKLKVIESIQDEIRSTNASKNIFSPNERIVFSSQ